MSTAWSLPQPNRPIPAAVSQQMSIGGELDPPDSAGVAGPGIKNGAAISLPWSLSTAWWKAIQQGEGALPANEQPVEQSTGKRDAYNVYAKLEVKKRTHAVSKARQLGLIL